MSARKLSSPKYTEKQIVESLVTRLNDLLKDPKAARNAARVLEHWINKPTKK